MSGVEKQVEYMETMFTGVRRPMTKMGRGNGTNVIVNEVQM